MPKYGKPIWRYVLEAANSLDAVFEPIDIIREVHSQNSEIPAVTIRSYVIGMAPNHPSSHHYESTRRRYGYLEYLGNCKFRVAREKVQPTPGKQRRITPSSIVHTNLESPFSHINRRYDKVIEMKRRVEDLIGKFGYYIDAFNNEIVFSGPSLYFHLKTLERGRELGNVETALFDSLFLDYLYATLASWGLHRMGKTGAKLVEYDEFTESLQANSKIICSLEEYSLLELYGDELSSVNISLMKIIENISISASSTQLVSGSKALHHILPNLVPPIDRNYTIRFFYGKGGTKQVPLPTGGDSRIFGELFPIFNHIAIHGQNEIKNSVGSGFHTGLSKVIDNAIMGYVLRNLPP